METINKTTFPVFFWRITSCHMISYFCLGILSYFILGYKNIYLEEPLVFYMRSTDSPLMPAGPFLQVFRGLLFALVLWPVRESFLGKKNGWLWLWLLYVGLAILGTSGPSPGSFEGMVFTKLSWIHHAKFLPEIILQTLLFSLLVNVWYLKPGKIWNVVMAVAVTLISLMSLAGFLAMMSTGNNMN